MRTIEEIFQKGLDMHHYANTAYPITPRSFREFKTKDKKEVDRLVIEQWEQVKEMGLYVHIPFCVRRCKFCEYCVFTGDDAKEEALYTKLLLQEINMFGDALSPKKIEGLDIGGGTPAAMSVTNLSRIVEALNINFGSQATQHISIETTPAIAAREPEKIKGIQALGVERISMGVQTINRKLLSEFRRQGSTRMYQKATDNIRKAGFDRFNIDVMYGFLNQTDDSWMATLEFVLQLNPEYITLYRNRYKDTNLEHEAVDVPLEKVNRQYKMAYYLLQAAGYQAELGKNTFSRVKGDVGTSAYLTKRVIEGMPYLGMGVASQSYSHQSIYYNQGAASKRLSGYKKWLEKGHFPIQDFYILPQDEMAAKMVSVAFYFGYIHKVHFKNRIGASLEKIYQQEMQFLIENELMEHQGDLFALTQKGKNSINGITALFYSQKEQEKMYAYAEKLGL